MNSNTEIPENRLLGAISTSSIRNFLPRSLSNNQKMNFISRKSKSGAENIPPSDPNVQIDNGSFSSSIPKNSSAKVVHSQKERCEPGDKKQASTTYSDPSVKIVVRIRPVNAYKGQEDQTIWNVSSNSLTVGDHTFTFDSVVDSNSIQGSEVWYQSLKPCLLLKSRKGLPLAGESYRKIPENFPTVHEDVFQLVGVPLVKNSLAGYNTSILSYGQTGSGKTYTMWGPPSAMVEGHSLSSHQGIGPRIFQMLFSEIQREQEDSEEKQINYQCRCSFLEIYNEQIGDLLDPTKRNLEIRDDAKNGFYVENLSEEYVTSYEDVTQILIKGLSNRKVGSTSINSKSSRSHIVFTCVIESWCKITSSKCFSSSKTSRISLIDLAGLERNKLDDAGRQCVKEGKNVKKSLSQLGRLVNILAEGAQSRKHQNIPYRSSNLTHLLRESLGGNVKLTVICAISPDDRCKGETLSTLRFGQRAKFIQNEPTINQITEDDVNDLSDQIRQLKEELIRAKSNTYNSVGSKRGQLKGQNVRGSLNQLRLSLNRSLILHCTNNDTEDEINVDEEDIMELKAQLVDMHSSADEHSRDPSEDKDCIQSSSFEENSETDIASEFETSLCPEESIIEENHLGTSERALHCEDNCGSVDNLLSWPGTSRTSVPSLRSSLSCRPCHWSPVLQDPTLSESPKIVNLEKKNTVTSSNLMENQNHVLESSKFNPEVLRQSLKKSDYIRSSLQSNKIFSGPTESLAASLHRGLQIIDYHQRNSASNKSSVSFSFEHLTLEPCQPVDKVNAGVQTLPEKGSSLDGPAVSFLCSSCKTTAINDSSQVQHSLNMWVVPVDESGTPERLTDRVLRDEEKELAAATKREKELEIVCAEQAAKIEVLNHLVEQLKHEREQISIIAQHQETKTLHLEVLKNDVIPIEEPKIEDHSSLEYENKKPQEELDHGYNNTSFNASEREDLLKEIQSLSNKLQSYEDASSNKSTEKLCSSCFVRKCGIDSQDKGQGELEKESQRWTEMESEWISLTEELRIDLESKRQHVEKVEMELRLEKKCTEELDDALRRAVLGHGRIVEHYVELQEKHNDLLGRYRKIMEGIAEVKKAAAKAGAKGTGSRFYKSLAAELSALRVARERERECLKKENTSLKIQVRDTAEAVHAAGELLVRLREVEEAALASEEKFMRAQQENEKLKKQMDKLKMKHKMEMITMKQYLAESRLPESALQPLYSQESNIAENTLTSLPDDDQSWRAEFRPIYQQHY